MKTLLKRFYLNGRTLEFHTLTFPFLLWNRGSNATLVLIADVIPPTFGVTCPTSQLLVYAERSKFSAQVNWNEPVAIDNLGAAPSLTSNYKPPQRFSQGIHVITYTAVDQSGNRATCTFAIKVIGITKVISCWLSQRGVLYEMLTTFIVLYVTSYQLHVTDGWFRRCTAHEQLC